MEDKLKGMLLGALVGDALALGVHWIYDVMHLRSNYGEVRDFISPSNNPYHWTKSKGEFTHYGDQILVLMESIVEANGFDLIHFSKKWQSFMETYTGYKDQASQITFQNLQKGFAPQKAGSPSNDLAGAVRSVAIGYVYGDDLDTFVQYAVAQTKLTHNDPDVAACASFFARVIHMTLKGRSPVESIREIANTHFKDTTIRQWVEKAFQMNLSPTEAVLKFGQSCHTPEAFPGVVYLIKQFEQDLEKAMIESVMAGGDNATRASAVGMILGTYHGMEKIPRRWVLGLSDLNRINTLMERLDEIRMKRQSH